MTALLASQNKKKKTNIYLFKCIFLRQSEVYFFFQFHNSNTHLTHTHIFSRYIHPCMPAHMSRGQRLHIAYVADMEGGANPGCSANKLTVSAPGPCSPPAGKSHPLTPTLPPPLRCETH